MNGTKLIKKSTMVLLAYALIVLSACGNMGILTNPVKTDGNEIQTRETAEESPDPRLEEYADLIINTGLNVQPGRKILIEAPVEQVEFVHMCTEKAYKAGASDVTVKWYDNELDHERYQYADDSVFDICPEYISAFYNEVAEQEAAYLKIVSRVPDLTSDVDSSRVSRFNTAVSSCEGKKNLQNTTGRNIVPWTIAAVPNSGWAQKVFPELSEEDAVDALWDALYQAVYLSGDGTSAENWAEHISQLDFSASKMNEFNFKTLHYTSSTGTDFTVDLPENHIWMSCCGSTDTQSFVANIPTEEIYTAPDKESGNGVIAASLPLVLDGTVVNDLKLKIENGKIVSVSASSGLDAVEEKLAVDEGASYLGEIALVPYDSPISQQGILYYDTLFDENSSSHIAFGRSYSYCIKNGASMTNEELASRGLNSSSVHVDFMIGTEDMKIVGTTHDGTEIVVFENGVFTPDFTDKD